MCAPPGANRMAFVFWETILNYSLTCFYSLSLTLTLSLALTFSLALILSRLLLLCRLFFFSHFLLLSHLLLLSPAFLLSHSPRGEAAKRGLWWAEPPRKFPGRLGGGSPSSGNLALSFVFDSGKAWEHFASDPGPFWQLVVCIRFCQTRLETKWIHINPL